MRTLQIVALALAVLPPAAWASVTREGAGAASRSDSRRDIVAVEGWKPVPLSRYEQILERKPFGKAPPPQPVAAAQPTAVLAAAAAANQLVLYAINRTPSGEIAVGFGDNSEKPPRNYYMMVGETQDKFSVLAASYEDETASIDKEGVTINLSLGHSERKVRPSTPDGTPDGATGGDSAIPVPKRPELPKPIPFATKTEQILGMIASTPFGAAPPPLPAMVGDDSKKALTNLIVIHSTDDEAATKHKENVAWIKEDMRNVLTNEGISASSYLARLQERQKAAEQTRAAETAKLRALAEKASREKIDAEIKAVNARLEAAGILAIEQGDVIKDTEAKEEAQ